MLSFDFVFFSSSCIEWVVWIAQGMSHDILAAGVNDDLLVSQLSDTCGSRWQAHLVCLYHGESR